MNLKGRSAIVAGGAGGLGSATVRRLVGVGIGVVVIDPDAERSEELRSELGDSGVRTTLGTAEDDQVVLEAITVAQSLGIFSIAISATGVLIRSPRLVDDEGTPISKDILKANLDVHVVGPFNLARLAAAAFASNVPDEDGQRGVIVQTASISAFDGQETMVPYAAAKGAIESMTLPMARDLAPIGVRVCAIAPGSFLTPLTSSPFVQNLLLEDILFPRRLGNPDEYASLVEAIVRNPYMNAEVIRLDGGARLSIAMGPRSV
jgi:3-hydroxyacyl-CoA dehydrogenase / 3-hydroxy-2-methylbutyryl-CoA dehydrogenase